MNPKMNKLLKIMNKEAIENKKYEAIFCNIPDNNGFDTENHYGEKEDIFIDQLINNYKIFNPDTHKKEIMVCDMPLGNCHKNVLEAKELTDSIYTGFAQVKYPNGSNGDWFPHSWIIDKDGNLVETFDDFFAFYYGTKLSNKDISLLEKIA